MKKWKLNCNTWISEAPVVPGIWERKDGGYFVRSRVTSPKTGLLTQIKKSLPEATLAEAAQWLNDEQARVRSGDTKMMAARPRFGGYAVSLYERKIMRGEIRSAKGREKWASILSRHLVPYFGDFYLDQIRRADIEAWKDSVAVRIASGKYSPRTANTWLSQLQVVIKSAVGELELERDPMVGVKPFDTSVHATYTDEEPNSLLVQEVPAFLECMREHYPQHYAFVVLGFATGLRPSSLRPLRRSGKTPDVLWAEGTILVRQSHTRRDEVMATTKTKRHQRVPLPQSVLDILRWHVANLPAGPMADSELLFPSEIGRYRAASALDKPFDGVCERLKLDKAITPRAMRRTFQDLCRAAEVEGVVTRAISGHATETMQSHYSSVAADEQRSAISKVVDLFSVRKPSTVEVDRIGGPHGVRRVS